MNGTKRIIALFATLFAIVLGSAATPTFASSPAIAATLSHNAPSAPGGAFDPHPGPPWVFSGYTFTSEGACEATGRAFVNSGKYQNWTCRFEGGVYRLYLIPGLPGCDLASLPRRLAALCP